MTRLILTAAIFVLAAIARIASLGAADVNAPMLVLARPENAPGVASFGQGDYEGAYRLFAAMYVQDPELPPPAILLAVLHWARGEYDEFYRNCARAVKENPLDPESWFRLGEIAVNEGRLVEASLLLERGNEVLARFEKENGRSTGAGTRFDYLKNDALSLGARLFEASGDFDRAEKLLRELTARSDQNDAARLSLGWILLERGKTDEALAEFDAARELNGRNLPGFLTAVVLLDRRRQTAEAQKLADERFDPENMAKNADYLPQMVQLYLKWNRLDQAEKIVGALPADSFGRRCLSGRIALYRGDYPKAESEYQAALLQNSDDFQARNGYALALAEINEAKRSQAKKIAAENFKRKSDSEEAAATLAWIELLSGQTERADELLRPIFENGSFTPTTAYYLAEVALALGENDLCGTLLDLALGQDENFPKRADAARLAKRLAKP